MAVLYYHRIGPFLPGEPRKMSVEPGRFRAQMEVVARRWRPATLDEIVDGPPGNAVAVTFDDGYRDLMAHAVPVLRELRIPATFFVVAGAVGGKDAWYRGDRELLTWEELEQLKFAGFEIGSHSMTHARLTEIGAEAARREIAESKRALEERLGVPVRHFAYPQGKHDEGVKRLVEEAGYRAAWATRSGEGGRWAMRRLRVSADTGTLKFRWKLWRNR
jgi:peptidoglycan/xylan/chitin deacetylase (PgdA/CDA1 family)